MKKVSVTNFLGIKAALISGILVFYWPQIMSAQIESQTSNQVQLAERLPELAAAVAARPDDLSARGSYAQALFLLENLPAAWEQLSAGYQIDPNHSGMVQGVQQVFRSFAQQGLFTVGTPQQTLIDVLGSPHQSIDMPWGTRLVFAYLAVDLRADRIHEIVDLRGITETAFRPTEIVTVDLDGRGWQVGFREKTKRSVTAMYYLPGESPRQWQEMVTVERLIEGVAVGTLEEISTLMIQQIKSANPECKELLLETNDDSLIVAFEGLGQTGQPRTHQLVRLFRGQKDIHRLAYSIKGEEPPPREIQLKWLEIFQSAQLRTIESDK
ncbi:MAG TPA: hypothetical protein PKD64_18445 [Pirellulaceae bacterium]|nr:hypothetical protein [Pirellulaceae bacterium]HMO94170.1 hypothetical protein [Pirellulaceae bacterium]HMP71291.1 hypothetical protein [Pirellulaceae bacterium]